MGAIRTHHMPSTSQEDLDAPIPVARVLGGELAHHRDHRCIALLQPRFIPKGRSRHRQQRARSSQRHAALMNVRDLPARPSAPTFICGDFLHDLDLDPAPLLRVLLLEMPRALHVHRFELPEPSSARSQELAQSACRIRLRAIGTATPFDAVSAPREIAFICRRRDACFWNFGASYVSFYRSRATVSKDVRLRLHYSYHHIIGDKRSLSPLCLLSLL